MDWSGIAWLIVGIYIGIGAVINFIVIINSIKHGIDTKNGLDVIIAVIVVSMTWLLWPTVVFFVLRDMRE